MGRTGEATKEFPCSIEIHSDKVNAITIPALHAHWASLGAHVIERMLYAEGLISAKHRYKVFDTATNMLIFEDPDKTYINAMHSLLQDYYSEQYYASIADIKDAVAQLEQRGIKPTLIPMPIYTARTLEDNNLIEYSSEGKHKINLPWYYFLRMEFETGAYHSWTSSFWWTHYLKIARYKFFKAIMFLGIWEVKDGELLSSGKFIWPPKRRKKKNG